MISMYASVALLLLGAALVGRAVMSIAGRREWTWLEPAVGLAGLFTVSGIAARIPGHGDVGVLAIAALLAASAFVVHKAGLGFDPKGEAERAHLRRGLTAGLTTLAVLSVPFILNGRFGLLGMGFNNDFGLHLAWSEWLKHGYGPEPDTGYPLGPHGVAYALARLTPAELGNAFTGLLVTIGLFTGLTAVAGLGQMRGPRLALVAALVAVPYLAASYFAQSAFKETGQALFTLAFALSLPGLIPLPEGGRARARSLAPPIVIALGIVFSYSFAGLAWPVGTAALWALAVPEVRSTLAPLRVLRFIARPVTLAALLIGGGLAVFLVFSGPFGFGSGFSAVAGANTYGPVSPAEALGFWGASNYRLDAIGGAPIAGVTSAIAMLALVTGFGWWVSRRRWEVPAGLLAGIVIYAASIPASGDYSRAKALIIVSPLVMLTAARPLVERISMPRGLSVARLALAVAFFGGAAYSSLLVLRDAPLAPSGHGGELQAFAAEAKDASVLYLGQDRFAAYELRGTDPSVPLVEFPEDDIEQRPTKPFDLGDAYSPIDFDSFKPRSLNNFDFFVTTKANYRSEAPPELEQIDETGSYILWKRDGRVSVDRKTLLEGTGPTAPVDCDAPESTYIVNADGMASTTAPPAIGDRDLWSDGATLKTGDESSQVLTLQPGKWKLSLQYFSPVDLTLSGPGIDETLPAALDGQRPNTISLINDGQYWPAGEITVSDAGPATFTVKASGATGLQDLTGYDGKAYLGELVATRAEAEKVIPFSAACGRWVDWYEGDLIP